MHNNHNTAVDNFQGENQRILYIIKNNPRRSGKGSPPRGALDEDIPDQQHVGDCAGGDGEEDVALPEVEAGGDEDADELRQAVAVAAEGDGSQAVDDQHRKMAPGRTFPRYCTNAGVFRCSLKIRNGTNRVSCVPSTHRAMVMICWVRVIADTVYPQLWVDLPLDH